MDFWDTILGHRLAETLIHTLPQLTETILVALQVMWRKHMDL